MSTVIKDFIAKLKTGDRKRILAYGSSNTERYLPGLHWFDCFEIAIREKYGRVHTCVNTGLSGDTSRGLLERFERDAEFYKPDLAFITIGGNDCNPDKNIPAAKYRENLLELHRRFTAMGCGVIFQTYYDFDPDNCESERYKDFTAYMEIVREVAAATDSGLIDHLRRWGKLRLQHHDIYISLMLNAMHVNTAGNKLMGIDIARNFSVDLSKTAYGNWDETLNLQKIMDELE
jgi:lysophospholipase L1-like esterase